MVESNEHPNLIDVFGDYIYIRKDITKVEETEEKAEHYVYNEILLKGYAVEFIETNKDDIFENPSNYNVIQINGVYTGVKPWKL